MDRLQLRCERGLLAAIRRQEEFLKAAVDKLADAARHPYSSPLNDFRRAGVILQRRGDGVARNHHTAARSGAYRKACLLQVVHALVECDLFGSFPTEEHEV